jgi:hypothetical protein
MGAGFSDPDDDNLLSVELAQLPITEAASTARLLDACAAVARRILEPAPPDGWSDHPTSRKSDAMAVMSHSFDGIWRRHLETLRD